MIKPTSDEVVVHPIHVVGGTAQVVATTRGNVAFVYGDDALDEAAVLIRARCPLNADVLDAPTCACATRSQRALSVARRARLGVFIYLESATVTEYADVLVLLAQLPNLRRIYLPGASAGDVALLRDATDLEIAHRPTLLPPDDPTWPSAEVSSSLVQRTRRAVARLRAIRWSW